MSFTKPARSREDVVVIAAQINDLRVALFQFLEDDADEARVGLGPLPGAAQLPAVDDVAVEDELLAADAAEKMVHLARLAVGRAEVHVDGTAVLCRSLRLRNGHCVTGSPNLEELEDQTCPGSRRPLPHAPHGRVIG